MMKYFKDSVTGKVFAFESNEERQEFGAPSLIPMTELEISSHLAIDSYGEVPTTITMRQARLLLHSLGLLDQVQASIDALPEPPRIAAQIEWDYSSEVHRDKEFVLMIAQQLELTDAQIDQMFIQAAAL